MSHKINKVIKIGLVGDGAVGKTSFLLTYTTELFITEYTPTIFDNFCQIESVGEDVFNVSLWDTAGQNEYENYRINCYNNCGFDTIFLCFSVVERLTFKNLRTLWIQEIKRVAPNVPLFIVGTQVDLRDDKNKEHVTRKEGEKLVKELKAKRYCECSAKDYESVHKIVLAAITDYQEREREMVAKIKRQYKKEIEEEERIMRQFKKEIEKQDKKDDQTPPSAPAQ